jgi:acylphosphatase
MTKEKMETKNQKVNVRVKGNLKHLSYKLHALIKATRLGLKTHKLINHKPGHIEMEFEGKRPQLWKIVKWSKSGSIFSVVDEVMFTFC